MSINKVILLGSLGQDPKISKTQNGKEYASFSLATSKKWKDQNGQKKDESAWHNISCLGSMVKVCQYLEKGSKVYLEGEIKYEKYTDKNGVEKNSTKIIASVIDIIKGKNSISKHDQDKANGYQPQKHDQWLSAKKEEFEDDEIPF